MRYTARVDAAKLHAVRISDVEPAVNALGDAFLEDPFFEYLFEPRHAVEGTVRTIHAFTLEYGIRYGEVYSPSADIEGVAIWLPPGNTTITAWKAIRAGVLRLRSVRKIGLGDRLSFAGKDTRPDCCDRCWTGAIGKECRAISRPTTSRTWVCTSTSGSR